jgi:NADH-quinone oxidoreductase subunit J
MTADLILFSILSILIMVFSVLTITSRRILRTAIYLLFVLIGTAGLYFILGYHFMGGVQLILYAGGIVVLIVFSILLTSHISQKLPGAHWINLISGIMVAVTGFILSIIAILNFQFESTPFPPATIDMKLIGEELMSTGTNGYALPFEVISILLLAAMIGAIVIAKKGKVKSEN